MSTAPEALAAIHAAAFITPRPWSSGEITSLLAGPGAFLLVEPGAFLMGRVIADEAELLTLAVRSETRRRGIGARLVTAFLHEAAARKATTAFLEVAADNTAALALYARAGFAETGCRPRYYTTPDGNQVDALILARALPAAPEKS